MPLFPLLRIAALAGVAALAACARTPPPAPVAAAVPPPVAFVAAPMPAGGRPGMVIPARLANGSFATPNQALSSAGAVWHLRTALNVAALACRGADEAVLVAGYNALLATRKAELAAAEAALAAEYKSRAGAAWRDTYDDAMTRLYNYWSQDFARAGFCAQARSVIAEAAVLPVDGFPAFAATRLATLDRPFIDFFGAYDDWRRQRLVIAPAAPVGPATPSEAPPRLTVDVGSLG